MTLTEEVMKCRIDLIIFHWLEYMFYAYDELALSALLSLD